MAGSSENGGENEGHECGSTCTYVGPKEEKNMRAFQGIKYVFYTVDK